MLARTNLRGPKSRITFLLTTIFCLCSCALFATTKQPSSGTAREYNAAIAQKQPADRIRDLELFALTSSGPLKVDALEVVVWEYLRAGNLARALTWANELNLADKGNALAAAVMCQDAQRSPQSIKRDELRKMANHGLDAMPRLRHPTGMSDAEFGAMRRQASLALERAAGQAPSQPRDYSTARNDSHHAATPDTSNAQSMYRMAMADLSGKSPNPRQGYWELARAVVLSGGSLQGRNIADEARRRYLKEGGTNAGWDQFLNAAEAGKPDLAPSARFASSRPITPPSSRPTSIPSQPPATALSQVDRHPKAASIKSASVTTKPAPKPDNAPPHNAQQTWAGNNAATAGIVRRHRISTGPMSLGILIETSLAGKGQRGALGNTLVDMLRHMGDDDEAFILSYDNQMVFEQDLTNDPKQLDEAMQEIRPRSGARLDEAVAFAARHLSRIASNPNRVLLVISDGRNVDSHTSALQTSTSINAAGVRIYCIGIGVDTRDERSHLQALSAGTGGQSDFISDSSQFRGATKQIAQNIGIDFRR
jgi:hypothetical protein